MKLSQPLIKDHSSVSIQYIVKEKFNNALMNDEKNK